MILQSTDGKTRVLSLSYGKDSMACLGAIEMLGWTLDRIITAEVWATDSIQAELPPMVKFKAYADKVILERYGIEVEHFYAVDKTGRKLTFERRFYQAYQAGRKIGRIYGWPILRGNWCNDLKMAAIAQAKNTVDGRAIEYIGIAADEQKRFHNLTGTKLSPLVEIGWTEADCLKWCEQQDLLSPIYAQSTRGGCWFCFNQSVQQLRLLRTQYPELWSYMLKWDADSPTTFHPYGHTVYDFDKRFFLEEQERVPKDRRFRWVMLKED